MELNKMDLAILKQFEVQKKNNLINSLKISDLMVVQAKVIKYNSAYKRIKHFISFNLIGKGISDCHTNTYYITQQGLDILSEINTIRRASE